MTTAGIVGISGYSGCTTLEILLKHPSVQVTYVSANNTTGPIGDIWPHLKDKIDLYCDTFNLEQATNLCKVIFLAVPHTIAMGITPKLLQKGVRVIDISGDYRLKDTSLYKKWYKTTHTDAENLAKAVYGLPELYREKIKHATLISNPGCYPTAAILGLAPIVSTHTKAIRSIIIDAKSGISGAGKKVKAELTQFIKDENFKAYKILEHQHNPEIDYYVSQLAGKSLKTHFVPHLLPVNHGILATIYVQLKESVVLSTMHTLYKRFYKTEPFVRVVPLGEQPELKNVVGTNFCDIGLALSESQNLLVITSAIDNLMKGAAGQAVQNMNIMFGFKEQEALT